MQQNQGGLEMGGDGGDIHNSIHATYSLNLFTNRFLPILHAYYTNSSFLDIHMMRRLCQVTICFFFIALIELHLITFHYAIQHHHPSTIALDRMISIHIG